MGNEKAPEVSSESEVEQRVGFAESVAGARERFRERENDYIEAVADAETFDQVRAVVQAYAERVEGQINSPDIKRSHAGRQVFAEDGDLTSSLESTLQAITAVEDGSSLENQGGIIVGEALWKKIAELKEEQSSQEN